MLRVVLLVAAALAGTTAYAEAGGCTDDSDIDEGVRLLEQRAKKPDVDMSYFSSCLPGAFKNTKPAAKRIGRINEACRKILSKTPTDVQCVMLAGMGGTAELGGVKIFEAVSGWNRTPWSDTPTVLGWVTDLQILSSLGDARAVPVVIERWKTFEVDAAKREAKSRGKTYEMMHWAAWRKQAAALLGALGGEAEAVFLEGQAKSTKDRHVKRACLDAVKAVRARAT